MLEWRTFVDFVNAVVLKGLTRLSATSIAHLEQQLVRSTSSALLFIRCHILFQLLACFRFLRS